jgi:hypothetical protein
MQKGTVIKQSGILTGNSIAILRISLENAKQRLNILTESNGKKIPIFSSYTQRSFYPIP